MDQVHSTLDEGLHGETSGNTSSECELPEFWDPIQVGNRAVCKQNFVWEEVDTVFLHDGTQCQWSIQQHDSFKTSFSPPIISFGGIQLPMKPASIPNFANKA
jgi:hypothetical protein